jgi:hypothetical protein
MRSNEQTSLDKGVIPITLVVGAFLRSWGAMVTLVVSSFYFGGQISELRGGLAQANARLDKSDAGLDSRVKDYQVLQRETNGRVSALEGEVKGFNDKLDLILRLRGLQK